MVPTNSIPLLNAHRPRRGSLPELKTAEKKEAEKKVPTGPRANPLYKTRLCMNFQSTGSCPYTDKCQFAHGVKELEKWESWRNSHKSADESKKESPEEAPEMLQGRARSQSMERTSSTRSSFSDHDTPTSPAQSLNWELSTPVRPSAQLDDDHVSFSALSNFSLWSSLIDELDSSSVKSPEVRSRAATFDSTYDNMSQLRDAPTLFPSPPVLPGFSKFTISH